MSDKIARVLALSVLVPLAVSAQVAREHDPVRLHNWPAPLYWQPDSARPAEALPEASGQQTATSAAMVFVAMTPCRVMDTRSGQGFSGAFGPPSIAAGLPVRTIPIQSSTSCSIPAAAQAYSFNVTVVPPGGLLYITLYPATANPQPSPPNSSTLNDPSGTIIANAAIVPAGTDASGSIDVFASSPTDLIIDINGFYVPVTYIQLSQGSAGSTAYGFSGDPGTGMYSSASGVVNLAAGGTTALSIGSGNNTSLGAGDLVANTGFANTAVGFNSLAANTSGYQNTATGTNSLKANTTGFQNTADGAGALSPNTTGSNNTAVGNAVLSANTTGTNNTAVGSTAMFTNSTGANNTAIGFQALYNANGSNAINNTAVGTAAMFFSTTGTNNTAIGNTALFNNTNGNGNTAIGFDAMYNNQGGTQNVAVGLGALKNNLNGGGNIGIGINAGSNSPGGSNNNIIIGSAGTANDSNTIRIGTAFATGLTYYQSSFFAAGIRGTTTGSSDAIPVVVDSNGQLGTVSSSRRFKQDIQDMGDASSGLLQLRPVTFRYRQPFADGSMPVQYGLIAEEVGEVFPDLVAHSADGQVESVKYQALDALLLNELQKQAAANRTQAATVRALEERLAALESARAHEPK